jgi:type I restriction enzyme S subunit
MAVTDSQRWIVGTLGDVTVEKKVRLGQTTTDAPVYGVERNVGLTAEPKYASGDLSRYKRLFPGMFAYNPMRLNIGSIGYCSDRHGPGVVSPDYIVFQCREDLLDPDYLAYYIRSAMWRDWTENLGVGSVRVRIYYRELARMPMTLPPVAEQRAIAHILGTLDDKIEVNRRMNETLDAIARALFKSWFVDFDPVRAKSEGRDPGLPPHLADLFPDSFENSELGEVPNGWRVVPIGELAVVVGGTTPGTKEAAFWEDGRNYWATPKDLSALAAPVLLETERTITDIGLAQIGSGLLPPGTVLLSSRAPIGYLAIAEVPLAINQGFIAMRPAPGVSNLFLLYWAEWAQGEIVSRANGSTFLEISKSSFRPIPVVAPPQEIFESFDQVARPVYSRIVANVTESRTLISLRDGLLSKLISGEVRVTDAERLVETGA